VASKDSYLSEKKENQKVDGIYSILDSKETEMIIFWLVVVNPVWFPAAYTCMDP
jgi:hypothetical protein